MGDHSLLKYNFFQPETAVRQLKTPHPVFLSNLTVNPYVGCEYCCPYCHGVPDVNDNEIPCSRIGIKTNVLNHLKKKLDAITRNPGAEKFSVMLGNETEPYQQAEREFNLTRQCIQLIMERKIPVQIFTKSNLILRDIDLLSDYSKQGFCAVNITVFTMDEHLKNIFEPRAPGIEVRMKLISALRKRDVLCGVAFIPVMPYINDDRTTIEEFFRAIKRFGAEYVVPMAMCFCTDAVRRRFFAILEKYFNNLVHRYEELYRSERLPAGNYAQRVNGEIAEIANKFNLPIGVPVPEFKPMPGVDIRVEPII